MKRLAAALFAAAAICFNVSLAGAQQPTGAVALGDLVQGLGVNTRVLIIGAHPDDEDTYLISWLARGRHVETAYLSLTRGEGGQNLIGNELGYALGQIRTEELLAARRLDGGHQYFSRAVDFGFSKSAVETAERWPRELILKDVVSVIRAFRPHVIVSVWTGTEADGHGHHQYAGLIAKEAFEAAADSARFSSTVGRVLPPWAAAKFYRVARVGGGGSITPDSSLSPGNVKFNVGEYSPLFGRSYAEIAAMSRSQHRSQAQGMVLPLGTIWDGLKLDTARIDALPSSDRDLFGGIDTTWARFNPILSPTMRPAIDSLTAAVREAQASFDAVTPSRLIMPLSRVVRFGREARQVAPCPVAADNKFRCSGLAGDLALALTTTIDRASRALMTAAGITVDVQADREKVAIHDSVNITIGIYNRGRANVSVTGGDIVVEGTRVDLGLTNKMVSMGGDYALRLGGAVEMPAVTYPWWLVYGVDRKFSIYDLQDDVGGRRSVAVVPELITGDDQLKSSAVNLTLRIDGTEIDVVTGPVVYRFADPARGERRHPLAGVPKITTVFQSNVEYVRANRPLDRGIRVEVSSAWSKPDTVDIQLGMPRGLSVDSIARRVVIPPFGKTSAFFRIQGVATQNDYKIFARATDRVGAYQQGFIDVEYDHINPIRYYQPPEIYLSGVDVDIPAGLQVAYVRGVGDNVQRMLEQLEVPVKALAAEALPMLDPKAYSTLVIGPRAFEANPSVAANAAAIQNFARKGGTVVVQYQQVANQPGVLPFPVTLSRPADRVTNEKAVVTFVSPSHRVLNAPNKITQSDFADWGQERGLYMPRAFDAQWKALFEMHDPSEPPNYGGLLVAPLGKGTYIYTTLSFFRQLPGGNPGAARLFVNLLSAGLPSKPVP